MTRRSHKIAVAVLFLLVLIAAIVVLSRSAAAQEGSAPTGSEFADCLTDVETAKAAEHFAQYCGRCHLAEKLAADAQKTGDRDQAKIDLAAFLTSHGSCSTEVDRAIADYIVDLQTAG
jgi:cytochrome c553